MPSDQDKMDSKDLDALLPQQPTIQDQQIEELQESLTQEQDARKEDRFVFIVICVILLDVVFFSVLSSLGGPISLLVLELLILIPLAKRLGMEEIAQIMSQVIGRVVGKSDNGNSGEA
jgi:hypothetical protein